MLDENEIDEAELYDTSGLECPTCGSHDIAIVRLDGWHGGKAICNHCNAKLRLRAERDDEEPVFFTGTGNPASLDAWADAWADR